MPSLKELETPVKITDDGRKIIGDGAQLDYLLPKQDYHSTWDSPEAFAKYIESADKTDAWHTSGWDNEHGEEFYGTKDMATALKLAKYGWKEGAERVERLRSRIKAANPKAPKLILHAIAGATPNVPRAVAGNLFNMRVPDAGKSHKKPVITLVANMSANCGIDRDMISNRAAVLAAIIDEIESVGYSCEVIATAMSRGHYKVVGDGSKECFKAATSIIVKASHQPVDVVRLAFALGHAALFRRLIFADWGLEKSCQSGLGYGLGNAGGGFADDMEELRQKGIYMLPSAETRSRLFKDEETSMDVGLPYLMQHLKEQGCPAFKHLKDWTDPEAKSQILLPRLDDDEEED